MAPGRADLLAQFAGTYLGVSLTDPVDQFAAQRVGQASVAARAGADMDAIARWISVGEARGETIQASRGRGIRLGKPPATPSGLRCRSW